jgi:hypothetical protein
MNKPEPVQIAITTKTVTHTVVAGKWIFVTSETHVPSGKPAPKGHTNG